MDHTADIDATTEFRGAMFEVDGTYNVIIPGSDVLIDVYLNNPRNLKLNFRLRDDIEFSSDITLENSSGTFAQIKIANPTTPNEYIVPLVVEYDGRIFDIPHLVFQCFDLGPFITTIVGGSADIRLLGDITTTSFTIDGSKNITISGRGHTLRRTDTSSIFITIGASGKLSLENIKLDGSSSTKHIIQTSNELILGSEVHLFGNSESAVYVNGGTFTIKGGKISDNNIAGYGGGVYVSTGEFIMEGGTISGNTASNGGGVCVGSAGKFTMNGGTISNNTATNNGGGVYVEYGAGSGGFWKNNNSRIIDNTASNGRQVYFPGNPPVPASQKRDSNSGPGDDRFITSGGVQDGDWD
ncbi:hypothetical protein AGMMS50230_03580 [Spirochaetia bacterium]|nr:hypothetical protein AGMMS50230_03580 [Spirochaetia bacterium]